MNLIPNVSVRYVYYSFVTYKSDTNTPATIVSFLTVL